MKNKLLLTSASQNDVVQIKQLFIEGVDLETKNEEGKTALALAIQNGHTKTVKLLLAAGANIKTGLSDGTTALMVATQEGHTEIVQLLLNSGANKDARLLDGNTALTIAIKQAHAEIVQLLLKAGANQEARVQSGTGRLMGTFEDRMKILRLPEGTTTLMLAIHMGHTNIVQLLLNAGVNQETQLLNGDTALILAARQGHRAIVQLLLATVEDHLPNDFTAALKAATEGGHTSIVSLFKSKRLEKFQYRLDAIQYQGEIPEGCMCPISWQIMNDPIVVSIGQTYDRKSLMMLFESNHNPETISCPLTRQPIAQKEVNNHTCFSIKKHIEAFVSAKEKEAQAPKAYISDKKLQRSCSVGSFFDKKSQDKPVEIVTAKRSLLNI